jgi:hypothetical protein
MDTVQNFSNCVIHNRQSPLDSIRNAMCHNVPLKHCNPVNEHCRSDAFTESHVLLYVIETGGNWIFLAPV